MSRGARVVRRSAAGLGVGLLAFAAAGAARAATTGLTPDTEFSALLGTGFNNVVETVTAASDGGFLVGGQFTSLNGDASIPNRLVRFTADRTLDTAFNAALGTGFASAVYAVLETSDGGFLVGGTFSSVNGDDAAPDRLVRLNADGTLDTDFADRLGTGFGGGNVFSITETSDGKILVGGNFTSLDQDPSVPDGLVRLNPDGSLDTEFADQLGTGFATTVRAVVQAPDGGLVVGGNFTSLNGDASVPHHLLRLNPDGTPDTAFNAALGTGFNSFVFYAVAASNGGYLVGGQFSAFDGDESVPDNLLRLTAAGTLDGAFNAHLGTGPNSSLSSLSETSDGDYLVGGWFTAVNDDESVPDGLVRLNADGSMDAGFNALLGTGFSGSVGGAVLTPDGGLVAGGWFTTWNEDTSTPRYLMGLAAVTVAVGPVADRSDPVGAPVEVVVPSAVTPERPVTLTATGLPDGLSLDPGTGAISGRPTTPGQFAVQVTATTGLQAGPLSDTASFTWTIEPAALAPTLAGSPGDGVVGRPYTYPFTVTGAGAIVTVPAGALPPGLTLSPVGVLSGTPTAPGEFAFTLTASNGVAPDATLQVSMRVTGVVSIELAHPERAPGQEQVAVAAGFAPGERVDFVLASDPVVLGTVVADAEGRARLAFTVPVGTTPGPHSVTASGPSGTASATFTVVTATGGTGTRDERLATSGADAGAWTAVAAALIATGSALLRRRRPAP